MRGKAKPREAQEKLNGSLPFQNIKDIMQKMRFPEEYKRTPAKG